MNFDVLIIGGGVIGLTAALEIRRRRPGISIMVAEAEKTLAKHGSGRNSGVLHSGIYYPPASLKAAMCAQGAKAMREYCCARSLPLRELGKILVPTIESEDSQLDLLALRAVQNGVEATMLDKHELGDLEPEAHSVSGRALHVPITSVCNPHQVMQALANDCKAVEVDLRLDWRACIFDSVNRTVTNQHRERLGYGLLINAAGLYADKIAHAHGIAQSLHILPFKGLYWKLDPASGIILNHLVYPVPDLRVPFLGVHTTTTTDGTVYLGPTAIPALGRENYSGLDGLRVDDVCQILRASVIQFVRNTNGFRRLSIVETSKLFKHQFANAARKLLPRIEDHHLLPCDKVGMRAQLYDSISGQLINDFVVEQTSDTVHVLNAISPAWTCAFAFAKFLCDKYIDKEQL